MVQNIGLMLNQGRTVKEIPKLLEISFPEDFLISLIAPRLQGVILTWKWPIWGVLLHLLFNACFVWNIYFDCCSKRFSTTYLQYIYFLHLKSGRWLLCSLFVRFSLSSQNGAFILCYGDGAGSGIKPLVPLSCMTKAYTVNDVWEEMRNSKIYIVPLNSDLRSTTTNNNQTTTSTLTLTAPCNICKEEIPLSEFRQHRSTHISS